MIDRNICAKVAADLAAIDFTAENQRIAELEQEITRCQAALDRAGTRVGELNDQIYARREASELANAGAVADALLTAADPSDAAHLSPSREELENDRAALQLGIRELNERVRLLGVQIDNIRREATQRLRPIAEPLVSDIYSKAQAAAETLRECFGALGGIERAIGAGVLEARAVRNGLSGSFADHGLLIRHLDVDVPAEIIDTLSNVTGKGAALRPSIVKSVRASLPLS